MRSHIHMQRCLQACAMRMESVWFLHVTCLRLPLQLSGSVLCAAAEPEIQQQDAGRQAQQSETSPASTSGRPPYLSTMQTLPRHRHEEDVLRIAGQSYHVAHTVLLLLRMLQSYMTFQEAVPLLAAETARRAVDLLKVTACPSPPRLLPAPYPLCIYCKYSVFSCTVSHVALRHHLHACFCIAQAVHPWKTLLLSCLLINYWTLPATMHACTSLLHAAATLGFCSCPLSSSDLWKSACCHKRCRTMQFYSGTRRRCSVCVRNAISRAG